MARLDAGAPAGVGLDGEERREDRHLGDGERPRVLGEGCEQGVARSGVEIAVDVRRRQRRVGVGRQRAQPLVPCRVEARIDGRHQEHLPVVGGGAGELRHQIGDQARRALPSRSGGGGQEEIAPLLREDPGDPLAGLDHALHEDHVPPGRTLEPCGPTRSPRPRRAERQRRTPTGPEDACPGVSAEQGAAPRVPSRGRAVGAARGDPGARTWESHLSTARAKNPAHAERGPRCAARPRRPRDTLRRAPSADPGRPENAPEPPPEDRRRIAGAGSMGGLPIVKSAGYASIIPVRTAMRVSSTALLHPSLV